MLKGIYCSNTALNAMQLKMNVIANNLANVNSAGFKQEKISFKTFLNGSYGVLPSEIKTDSSPGNSTDGVQGQVEGSNVDMIYNLTEMISAGREYAFNSRLLMSQDEILKKAAEDIGSLK
jgi:flagellar basal-body rod protein FlgB